jgi:predicted HTH domain antitoxin
MKLQLEMDLPEHLVDKALGEKAMAKAREEIVLDLFAQRKIPGGRSAHLLGLTKRQFMQLCQQRGVSLVDYTVEDLTTDLAVMDKLRTEQPLETPGADRLK